MHVTLGNSSNTPLQFVLYVGLIAYQRRVMHRDGVGRGVRGATG